MSLTQLSAFEVAQKVRTGEVKAADIVQSALSQISALDGVSGSLEPGNLGPIEEKKVHAFIQITQELALAQAEKVDRMIANGDISPGRAEYTGDHAHHH
jgi:Asp-tRNA(Asn)/Glu-tRNA(Gln) amidotransferase A subunit family amidase